MTTGMPTRAPPMAKESQYFWATKVDPKAPVIKGMRALVLTVLPNSVSRETLGKMQSSALSVSPPARSLGAIGIALNAQGVVGHAHSGWCCRHRR
jgi:hypothetical protein